MRKLNIKLLISVLFISLLFPVHAAIADGTETLGAPSISIAAGSGIISAGTGMVDISEGIIIVNIPAKATVEQVLLYWEGQMKCETGVLCLGDDSVEINGQSVQGDVIGGPTNLKFKSADTYDVVSSTYRADISKLNLVLPGANVLKISEMDFTYSISGNGAGVFVIYNNGVSESEIGVLDGNDFAYWDRELPLNTTKLQTLTFSPTEINRVATLNMFFSSVSGSLSGGDFRPSVIEVTIDGVTKYYDNFLNSVSGDEWDTLVLNGIQIPAGISELQLQAFSEDRLSVGNNPASFNWIAAGLSIPNVTRFGGCTPGYWKQAQHFDSWVRRYAPEDKFEVIFGCSLTIKWSEKGKPGNVENPTLLQALQASGGGQSALARHAVAALLNAANPDVDYPRTEGQIKQMVCEAISNQNIEKLKDDLAEWNELGCTANESEDILESDSKYAKFSDSNNTEDLNKVSGSGGCFISNLY